MATIASSNFAKDLLPLVTEHFGLAMEDYPSIIPDMFEHDSSNRAFEERTIVGGLGLSKEISEGAALKYDNMQEGYTKRFTHIRYGNGFIVTKDALDDGQSGIIIKMRSPELKKSILDTREIEAVNVFNRAFSGSYLGGDGKRLCATDHPTLSVDNSNRLATAADLSEASLEQAMIDIRDYRNYRGLRMMARAVKLLVPDEEIFNAHRILKTVLRPGTSDNDANAIRDMNMIPGGVVGSPYLSDTDAFFLLTNVPNGLMYLERKAMYVDTDNDFDTENAKFAARIRFSTGWANPLSVFGSPGA